MGGLITLELKVPFVIKKEKKWYVAICPLLDVATQGVTKEKAKSNLAEALQLFILGCIEMGTLDEVLKQSGFKKFKSPSKSKKQDAPTFDTIDIPLQAIAEMNNAKRAEPCRA